MPSLPSSLALTTIATNAQILSADHRNNYTAIQTAVNALITDLSSGSAGAPLLALGASSIGWAANVVFDDANKKLTLGGDANIYRLNAGELRTDSTVLKISASRAQSMAYGVYTAGETNNTFQIYRDGGLVWHPINGAADVSLSRVASNTLQVGGMFCVSGDGVTPSGGVAGGLVLRDKGGTNLPGALTNGGILYVSGGTLYFRSTGNIIAIAGP